MVVLGSVVLENSSLVVLGLVRSRNGRSRFNNSRMVPY
jgi:hypothetical protein